MSSSSRGDAGDPAGRALRWLAGVLLIAASAGCLPDPCAGASGTSCTWAGVIGRRGFNGDGLARTDSYLFYVADLTFAPDGRAWIIDFNNHRVRRVEADGTLSTVVGTDYEGDGPPGETDRLPAGAPVGAPATTVALNHPTDLEFAADGDAYLAAWHNNKIRVLDPQTGVVTVLAGDFYGDRGDGGAAWQAEFNQPKAIAFDEAGGLFVIDQRNQRIRYIAPDGERIIDTVAGTGARGYAGDGALADAAEFAWDDGVTPLPSGALAYRDGLLYIADSLNHRIRRLDPATGAMECVAGDGQARLQGDGGPALEASLNQPLDLEFGPDGRLYVADTFNHVVRAIDLDTGLIEAVAGTGEVCDDPFHCVEDAPSVGASDLRFSAPYGIAFDDDGALYVADAYNSRIVRVAP